MTVESVKPGPEASRSTCDHCELPIPDGELVVDEIDGQPRNFCCIGCRGAYRIITGAGLERFYRQRNWQQPGLPEGAFQARYDETFLQQFVQSHPDGAEFSFLLEGLRCATCVWLVEKVLSGLDGVHQVRVNYGTHRARVCFDPQRLTPGALFNAIAQLGYRPRPFTRDATARLQAREKRSLLIRFGTAFFLSMQLMGYSFALYAGYFQGMDPLARRILQLFAAAVTTPVVFYSGWPFLAGAWRSLCNRAANMDLLIALGVLAAYAASLAALVRGGEVYFDSAAMIITLLLAGRLFENAARRRAATGVDRLMHLSPDTALRLIDDGAPIPVSSSTLQSGDRIRILPGERLPTDGRLLAGVTEIDLSAATGEPLPQLKQPGDELLAGTLNLLTPIDMEVTRPAADSFIARVARLVEEAQARRAPIQRLADQVAAWFVPAVVALASLSWLYWSLNPHPEVQPLLAAVSVLVIACPCALGLATPTAVLVASGVAAEHGILYRGGDVIEATARIDRVAFDKTGTLTEGLPSVTAVKPVKLTTQELLGMAAAIEAESSHPLANGICVEARQQGLQVRPLPNVTTLPGRGLRAPGTDGLILAGNQSLLAEHGVVVPQLPATTATAVHLAAAGEYLGHILLEDQARPQAAHMVRTLQQLGIRTSLLTGDTAGAGRHLAAQLGIGEVHGDLTPEQKAVLIGEFQDDGQRVMMVGDGINDAPALSAAEVGCAMAGGTDIAMDSSDLVLTKPDLAHLLTALALARRTLRVIRQNLFWAFAYNLCALPLAATGQLAPIHAAAAMALSSVCVVGNSLRLKKAVLTPEL